MEKNASKKNDNTKLQEYLMLRQELSDEMKAQDTVINICFTSVTAIIAFAFSQEISLILLASYPVLFFLLAYFKRHRERIMHISGYMIVFLEPVIDISWETHGYEAYKYKKASIHKQFWKTPHYHFWGVLGILTLIAAIVIDFSNKKEFSWFELCIYLFHLIGIITIYVSSYGLAKASKIRNTKVDYWQEIKNQIEMK